MELDRRNIERRDFPSARRGYDPDAVDAHLRQVADAVERLRSAPAAASVSGAAAERVQAIVHAAEQSARDIEQHAQDEAGRTADRAETVVAEVLERSAALQEQVDRIVEQLSQAAAAMQADVRSIGETRPAAPPPPPPPPPPPAPAPVAQKAAAQVQAIPQEPAAEPGPPDAKPEVVATVEKAKKGRPGGAPANEGARLIALNMALSGTPREETARYLRENFDLSDQDDLLDEVYAKAGG